MRFRLQAFATHLLASAVVLTLVLSGLYLGWYRWPGWYLSNALNIAPLLACIDVVLGPLTTLLIANPVKARRELARDLGVIVTVQFLALFYGAATLWHGRPLYYAFSEDRLQLVQASDLSPREWALADEQNPPWAPHWYSRPRWVFAPLPDAPAERAAIIASARQGGDDVIQMPRYFRAWEQGLPALRRHLLTVGHQGDVRFYKKQPRLEQQLVARGFDPAVPATMIMTGRSAPLLAVFDRESLQIKAYLRADQ